MSYGQGRVTGLNSNTPGTRLISYLRFYLHRPPSPFWASDWDPIKALVPVTKYCPRNPIEPHDFVLKGCLWPAQKSESLAAGRAQIALIEGGLTVTPCA